MLASCNYILEIGSRLVGIFMRSIFKIHLLQVILVSGLLWADESEPSWIDAPVIDLDVYDGIGSLLLDWSFPDTIQAAAVRIYDRNSNIESFELKVELITISNRYLDTNCEQQDRYFYLVEIVDVFGKTFHSDDQHPPFGSCLLVEDEPKYEKVESIWDLMKQTMAETLVENFPLLTDETVSALLKLLELEDGLQFAWIEEFPLHLLPELEPIIGDVSETLFNEDVFKSVLDQEKIYRNQLLMTPFEWTEKITELYQAADDEWESLLDSFQSCYDRISVLPPIRISGGAKHEDGTGELVLHLINPEMLEQENIYLLANEEYLDIPLAPDILFGSEIRVNVPAEWNTVILMQGETILQEFSFVLDIPVIITFDGELIPVESLNRTMTVSRSSSELWLNEIIWKPQTSSLHLEVAGQSFGESQFGIRINGDELWNVDWTPDYDLQFQDSVFTVDSLNSGKIILSWNLVQDDMNVPLEFVILEDSTGVIKHRFPDGGPWQDVEYSTLGMANQDITSDLQIALIPELFVMYQNFPNPFNNNTRITFDLLKDAIISLYVTDATGRVKTIFTENEYYTIGNYHFNWSGENHSTGIYFFTIQAQVNEFAPVVFSRKMIYLK